MKKNPIASVILLLLLAAACRETETYDTLTPAPIKALPTSVGTRATSILGVNEIYSFSLIGSATGEGLFNAATSYPTLIRDGENHWVDVLRTNATAPWIPSAENYWWLNPKTRYTFFGFSPSYSVLTANGCQPHHSSSSVPGPPSLTYTVPQEVTRQVDLLYGNLKDIFQPENHTVSLPMKHALAFIAFSAAPMSSGIGGTEWFRFRNIKLSGNSISSARLNLMNGTWTPTTEASPFQYTIAPNTVPMTTGVLYQLHTPLEAPNNYLMILPLEQPEMTIQIEYQYGNGPDSDNITWEKDDDDSINTYSETATLPRRAYQSGKIYTFTLKLTKNSFIVLPDGVNTIEDWLSDKALKYLDPTTGQYDKDYIVAE